VVIQNDENIVVLVCVIGRHDLVRQHKTGCVTIKLHIE